MFELARRNLSGTSSSPVTNRFFLNAYCQWPSLDARPIQWFDDAQGVLAERGAQRDLHTHVLYAPRTPGGCDRNTSPELITELAFCVV